MTEATEAKPYTVVPAYTVLYSNGVWQQIPQGLYGEHLCMPFDEAMHSLRVQGNAFVDGAVCLAVQRALGVVPVQEVAA